MDMETKYNTRNPGLKLEHKLLVTNFFQQAVKRLMREACELSEATDEYYASPLEDNLFEWHFTIHGTPGSEFEGGVYHGRILLPAEYPMKPPNIILLTPNGRFETNKKICLSISGFHPETWRPSWSIRTALLALIAFMSSPGNGAIGSLEYSLDERRLLAKRSLKWECYECGKVADLLSSSRPQPATEEECNLINRIALKAEDVTKKDPDCNKTENDVSNVLMDSSETKEPARDLDVSSPTLQQTEPTQMRSSENNNLKNLMWAVIGVIVILLVRRLFLIVT